MSISHSLKQVSKSNYACNCTVLFSLQNLRKSWIISMEAKKKDHWPVNQVRNKGVFWCRMTFFAWIPPPPHTFFEPFLRHAQQCPVNSKNMPPLCGPLRRHSEETCHSKVPGLIPWFLLITNSVRHTCCDWYEFVVAIYIRSYHL